MQVSNFHNTCDTSLSVLRMGAADVETKFVSVERVAEYMRLEGETEGSGSVDDSWPQGEVTLEAVARQMASWIKLHVWSGWDFRYFILILV